MKRTLFMDKRKKYISIIIVLGIIAGAIVYLFPIIKRKISGDTTSSDTYTEYEEEKSGSTNLPMFKIDAAKATAGRG